MSTTEQPTVHTSNEEPPSKKIKTVSAMQSFLKTHPKLPSKPLVWIDCEMTGLDVFGGDNIIEICCIITDGNLNIVDEVGYESTIYYPKERLDEMNPWCIETHGKSGLTQKILDHPEQTLEKVQRELLEYIKKYIPEQRTGLIAGNSVHMDKFFMMKEFPEVIEHLHYRLIDVSSIMETGYRHNPALMKCCPKKVQLHTAKSDILESINQLKWYVKYYLKSESESQDVMQEYEKQNKVENANGKEGDKEDKNGEGK
ncbi:uncharacterized protein SPAPADRAFT_63701 [Spathaspora passalidarum NRRL Y-27907]|uniref:Exonuclease domain-containing protein n=1 Tax=Spathaspora passalidarum (strain NRRL Y-27907 / 11-Y1) TaxID=619300 RepID=G3AV06_SPAPN|nr:uncharacterized protein SPAPADRAFT_63701 [Spathaspora passalidarum NRRL Y-27907]EGW30080.1 hypothetical protein SPAPADRAFT_63701 [Spathaspora passalidarum NRRL Y-27907]